MADITITIPNDQITRVLNSFNWVSTKDSIGLDGDFKQFRFSIDEKSDDETNLVYGKRFIREMLLNVIRTYELNVDIERYNDEINTLTKPNQNVSDELII